MPGCGTRENKDGPGGVAAAGAAFWQAAPFGVATLARRNGTTATGLSPVPARRANGPVAVPRRPAYHGARFSAVETYDLVVIGSGPAGEKGAAQAAYFGKRVALVERAPHVGGAGINTGTVPSKTLRETALYFSGLKQRGLYGVDYSLKTELSHFKNTNFIG